MMMEMEEGDLRSSEIKKEKEEKEEEEKKMRDASMREYQESVLAGEKERMRRVLKEAEDAFKGRDVAMRIQLKLGNNKMGLKILNGMLNSWKRGI